LNPVISAFLLPATQKRDCVQIIAARYCRELARLAKFTKYRAREKKRILQYVWLSMWLYHIQLHFLISIVIYY